MKAGSPQPSENAWRDLYLSALFEADPAKLLERIAEAEYALSLRERELWYSGGDHAKEKLALTGALRALEVLRNIHQYTRAVTPPPARQGSSVLRQSGRSATSFAQYDQKSYPTVRFLHL